MVECRAGYATTCCEAPVELRCTGQRSAADRRASVRNPMRGYGTEEAAEYEGAICSGL